jgi:hypothetical protein
VYRNYFEIQFTGLWAVPLLSASSMLEWWLGVGDHVSCIMYASLSNPNLFPYSSTVGTRARFQVRIPLLCCMLSGQNALRDVQPLSHSECQLGASLPVTVPLQLCHLLHKIHKMNAYRGCYIHLSLCRRNSENIFRLKLVSVVYAKTCIANLIFIHIADITAL